MKKDPQKEVSEVCRHDLHVKRSECTSYAKELDEKWLSGQCLADFVKLPMFWRPDYCEESPWLEHLPLVFWLMQALKPEKVVSLGNDLVSHFALCQASANLRLGSHCYLVTDTEQQRWLEWQEVSQRRYPAISHAVQADPLQAVAQFDAASIDLLILNTVPTGSHSDDWIAAWLPCLSSRGVVLLSGTSRRDIGCNIFRDFDKLAAQYPHVAFHHGDGVGLLMVGETLPPLLGALLNAFEETESAHTVMDIFARLGQGCQSHWQLARHEDQSADLSTRLNAQIQSREAAENSLGKARQQLDQEVALKTQYQLQNSRLVDKVQQFKSSLDSRCEELGELTSRYKKMEQALVVVQATNAELEQRNAELEQRVKALSQQFSNAQGELKDSQRRCKFLQDEKSVLSQELAESLERVKQQESEIDRQNYELAELVRRLESLNENGTSNKDNERLADTSKGDNKKKNLASKKVRLTRWEIYRQTALIKKSGWFDSQWYLEQNPDVAADKRMAARPARHYLLMGGFEGRNPCSGFDSDGYLRRYPDVLEAGINPLVHYLKFGVKEHRIPKE